MDKESRQAVFLEALREQRSHLVVTPVFVDVSSIVRGGGLDCAVLVRYAVVAALQDEGYEAIAERFDELTEAVHSLAALIIIADAFVHLAIADKEAPDALEQRLLSLGIPLITSVAKDTDVGTKSFKVSTDPHYISHDGVLMAIHNAQRAAARDYYVMVEENEPGYKFRLLKGNQNIYSEGYLAQDEVELLERIKLLLAQDKQRP